MRGKRLFVLIVAAVLLILPLLFSLGSSGMVGRLFFRIPNADGASTPSVFVDPAGVIDSRLQASNASKFTVHINVSDVTDLFTWQLNVTWGSSVLNLSRIIVGEFLARAGPTANTSSSPIPYGLGHVINVTNNGVGEVAMTESILGEVSGITGNGTLVSLEFLVLGYGHTSLNISVNGLLPTTLLNSTGSAISFTTGNGYFRNVLPGDVNEDRIVDVFDVLKVKYHRSGPPPGPGGYLREADINDDGYVDVFDILIVKANLGRSI